MTAQVMTTEEIRANRAVAPRNTQVGMTNSDSFDLAQRAGKLLASSGLVPKEYQGNVANCVVALNMACRIGADPLMVMQNLVIVHNRPTWSSQFLIATFNACGRFSALRYEFFGEQGTDTWGCRAYATEIATGEKITGSDITIALAKAEGWYGKGGSKWKTMPQQMLMYRAASWLVRAYAPELAMGLHTAEEVQDTHLVDVTPQSEQLVEKVEKTVDNIRNSRPARTAKPETVVVESAAEPAPEKTKPAKTAKATPEPKPEPAGMFDDEPEQAQAAGDPERVAKLLESIARANSAADVRMIQRYTNGLNDSDIETIVSAREKRTSELMNAAAQPTTTEKLSLKARMEACNDSDVLGELSTEIEFLDPAIQQAMWDVYDKRLNELNA
ncbi:hypothetical protein [Alkanindiges illinoisensis]|uniref:hypothetical protein n=1 Tax=Alkanindiges illinoisensis TaxID=197183 RepID=UPI00196B97B3|nr:hypothetical protein [Alkanindiges illinoisensis]